MERIYILCFVAFFTAISFSEQITCSEKDEPPSSITSPINNVRSDYIPSTEKKIDSEATSNFIAPNDISTYKADSAARQGMAASTEANGDLNPPTNELSVSAQTSNSGINPNMQLPPPVQMRKQVTVPSEGIVLPTGDITIRTKESAGGTTPSKDMTATTDTSLAKWQTKMEERFSVLLIMSSITLALVLIAAALLVGNHYIKKKARSTTRHASNYEMSANLTTVSPTNDRLDSSLFSSTDIPSRSSTSQRSRAPVREQSPTSSSTDNLTNTKPNASPPGDNEIALNSKVQPPTEDLDLSSYLPAGYKSLSTTGRLFEPAKKLPETVSTTDKPNTNCNKTTSTLTDSEMASNPSNIPPTEDIDQDSCVPDEHRSLSATRRLLDPSPKLSISSASGNPLAAAAAAASTYPALPSELLSESNENTFVFQPSESTLSSMHVAYLMAYRPDIFRNLDDNIA